MINPFAIVTSSTQTPASTGSLPARRRVARGLHLGHLRALKSVLVRRFALDRDVASARCAADGKAVEILDTAAAKPRADEAIEALAEVEQIEQAARNRKDALTKEAKTVKPSVEVKP